MTPLAPASLFPLLATLAVIGIIYGALAALAQTDIKRLVAYSSVSHMGFIVLGMFALNSTGLAGSAIQMLNHGLTTGALFACVGMIYERYHTRDMTQLGGLWNRLPLLAFFLILAALGSAALPGLNGFVGEFPILVGAFADEPARACSPPGHDSGGVLSALDDSQGPVRAAAGAGASMARDGEPSPAQRSAHAAIPPLGWHEIAGLTPLMFLIVVIGVYPRPFLEQMRPAVARIDRTTQAGEPADRPDARLKARRDGGAAPSQDEQGRCRRQVSPARKASRTVRRVGQKTAPPAGSSADEDQEKQP